MTEFKILLLAFASISLITFLLYGIDKRRAKHGRWRISEKALLAFSFFGGGVGGILAMQLFRHKTRHLYFYAVNIIGVLSQVGLLAFLFVKEVM